MNERTAVTIGAVVGAAIGAMAGFLFLTERGSRLRQDLEPRVEGLLRDVGRLGDTFQRAREAATEGWQAVKAEAPAWSAETDQRAPF